MINLFVYILLFSCLFTFSGTKATSTVNVHILDVNDNRPSFTSSKFHGHISETATVGSLILKSTETYNPLVIEATDKDSGMLFFSQLFVLLYLPF